MPVGDWLIPSINYTCRGRFLFPTPIATVVLVISAAWACGRLVRVFGQPSVVGELIAGIALGPSVFGAFAPALAARVFDVATVSALDTLARAAILVFMCLVGLELDTAILRRHAQGVIRIAVSSLVLPFAIGCALAIWLYPALGGEVRHQTAFTLFVGTAMSITALPVLTRILTDWRMLTTTIGTIAVGCAAIDDIVAWTMLGFVVGLVRGQASGLTVMVLAAVYVGVMVAIVRPALARLARLREGSGGRVLWPIVVVVVAALSSVAAERIGIHAVFGAFLAGACVPRGQASLEGLEAPLRRVSVLLLPAFFVLVGLRTQIAQLEGSTNWAMAAAILVCASVGKIAGSAVAARTAGFSWRDALAIGSLLNTRGLVALVALDIGRALGILSPALFTMFVIMTLVTTFATVPLLRSLGLRPS